MGSGRGAGGAKHTYSLHYHQSAASRPSRLGAASTAGVNTSGGRSTVWQPLSKQLGTRCQQHMRVSGSRKYLWIQLYGCCLSCAGKHRIP